MAGYERVASFATPSDFRKFIESKGYSIPMVDELPEKMKLAEKVQYRGRTIGNRWAILPMEGWDCNPDGSPSELTRRRWLRFATSGAKLIYGTEACAVMKEGKSNTRQLTMTDACYDGLAKMVEEMRSAHAAKFGTADDLLIGLQLTHSGRFSHPNDDKRLESRTAYRHPLLDKKFNTPESAVVTDDEIHGIVDAYRRAAVLAARAGFDFVDVKQAHGYLGHEFLSAVDRPGPYGGSFENRTRFFREIVQGIMADAPGLNISCRLSICDFLPWIKNEAGQGVPMEWKGDYPYAFGGDGTGFGWNLDEPVKFVKMAHDLCGLDMICATIASPYYNVHYQRPAYFAVADGWPPPVHPLEQVARHLKVVAEFKRRCPDIMVVGSGYTCLQDYLPNVGEAVLEAGQADFVGIGRMVLSYPEICDDVLNRRPLARCKICRTIGDCTNAPRHGLVSGCYPLDGFYKEHPHCAMLKEAKAAKAAR
ncbi:MAG: hypothetical protein MJ025_02295 [Victivallaceae bacterium]|nr:hypothetical protein [Victivallaceae bacterium]